MEEKTSDAYSVNYHAHETLSQGDRYIEALSAIFIEAEAKVVAMRNSDN
jgi:hypothetical protein